MELIAALILVGLLVGYLVLAGCDIGLGMLMPYLTRGPQDRRRATAAIAPYFLGTEVWLVAAVGLTAGVFPELKTAVLNPLWGVFLAILAGWLWRDAGLWFRARVDTDWWRRACDTAIVGGSWTLAVGWGLAIGGTLAGGTLQSPFALACAATVVLLFALRGAAFGAERLVPVHESVQDAPAAVPAGGGGAVRVAAPAPSAPALAESADVAGRATRLLSRSALAGVVVTLAALPLPGGPALDRIVPAAVVAVVLAAALTATVGLSGPRWSRHTSALAIAAPVLLVATAVELPLGTPPGPTLTLVLVMLLPAVPVALLGQIWLYRMVRTPTAATGFFA
ncbi:cytochrome bd-I ubiquinol oxidase subunit 2 apoprotein [Murinocardiopsis flavida]|uniref:Cytochrome bd-I ubiquinol oxidase subunit 2 apoprotein n=1 Tax=Murinocardiopsis flavida TaxID=645275 RepID=A0A2P8DV42_9ACTN|nr:cytochrome d ubiquinol oxidase subunit II [Murinocardiopsis flavida]PSL01064.1 cytochrome bd-I ubiquinol oxidase subunit 2 apoprotein [Murinocardiopsis flavida]